MTWRPSRTPRECREIKEQYTVGRFVIHSYGNGKRLFLVTKNPCISFSALNPNVCTQKNGEPKGAEHMSRGPVVQVIEAAAQRLAVQRDGAFAGHLDGSVQLPCMAAEGPLQIVPVERQEQTAQGVHRRRPAQAGAESGVQAVALDGD